MNNQERSQELAEKMLILMDGNEVHALAAVAMLITEEEMWSNDQSEPSGFWKSVRDEIIKNTQ